MVALAKCMSTTVALESDVIVELFGGEMGEVVVRGRTHFDSAMNVKLIAIVLHVFVFETFLDMVAFTQSASVDYDGKGKRVGWRRRTLCHEYSAH